MAKKKYLPLYYKWIKVGEMPTCGLCCFFDANPTGLEFDFPKEFELIYYSVPFEIRGHYWAQDDMDDIFTTREFTPLRQNIILLMAAMAGEL